MQMVVVLSCIFISRRISAIVLWFLQPVGFVTFATKDDAEAAKLEMQVVFVVDFCKLLLSELRCKRCAAKQFMFRA